MKKKYILGIVLIAAAVAVVVSTTGNASTYVTFREAREIAKAGKGKVHVVGKLKKDASGAVTGIDNSAVTSFSFTMIDNSGEERKVFYKEPQPPDFEKSEQIVVIGSMKGDIFIADKILMKCPSKYQNKEIKT